MKMLNYSPEAIKSMYKVLNPDYAPSFNTVPNSDPIEANLEVSTFAEANAVIDYIRKL
jgi:hypothetical protein